MDKLIIANLLYVVAAVLFILGLKKLSHPKTARNGNLLASVGMLIAIVATVTFFGGIDYKLIILGMIIGSIIGALFAIKVEMTQMPQMVALFNGFGGGASALVAAAEFYSRAGAGETTTFLISTIALSVFVGTLTFTGSLIAFAKLQGLFSGQPIVFKGQQALNAIMAITMIAFAVGMVVVPEDVITGTNNRATESRGGRTKTRAVVIVDHPVAAVIVAIDRVRIAVRKSRFLRSRLQLYPMGKVWNPLRVRSSWPVAPFRFSRLRS